jgi:hypothetical protein
VGCAGARPCLSRCRIYGLDLVPALYNGLNHISAPGPPDPHQPGPAPHAHGRQGVPRPLQNPGPDNPADYFRAAGKYHGPPDTIAPYFFPAGTGTNRKIFGRVLVAAKNSRAQRDQKNFPSGFYRGDFRERYRPFPDCGCSEPTIAGAGSSGRASRSRNCGGSGLLLPSMSRRGPAPAHTLQFRWPAVPPVFNRSP